VFTPEWLVEGKAKMSAVDPQTAFYVRQAFADLVQYPTDVPISPPPLTREAIVRDVHTAFAELDLRQLAISRQLSPAQRLRQVYELNRFLRHATLAAIRQQRPHASESELRQEFLRRMGMGYDQSTRV
jgi:hypothetical protein